MSVPNLVRRIRTTGIKTVFSESMNGLLFGPGFTFFERVLRLHVLPIHYYSPVPDTCELRRTFLQWFREGSYAGIDFNLEEQKSLLETLRRYEADWMELPPHTRVLEEGFGEGYGEIESNLLYKMILHLKPERIIEVGGGVSTFYSARALGRLRAGQPIDDALICVEPCPRPPLRRLQEREGFQLVPKPAQNVELAFFRQLQGGDILFIDSSHIVRLGNEVMYLYLEVLPNLKPGVIVHIHDVPFPYPSLDPEHWVFKEHQFWTEAALVQAFLTYSSEFRIILCTSYLHFKAPDVLLSTCPVYDPTRSFPSALWIRRAPA